MDEHPRALAVTPAGYPLALVRLAHALIEAGYQAVAAPACAGCGKVTTGLRHKAASGRVCGACAARAGTGTCARCGRARRINARRPEGGICSACYDKDEQVVTECGGCGREHILRHAPATFRFADIRTALPGVSDQTIRLALEQLRNEGRVRAD